jgi:acylphosphatase
MKRIAFLVRGRVQGVWFRASTREAASRLGVTGWVMNRRDGAVAGEAQGDAQALEAFRNYLREGPPHATVDEVEIEELAPRDDEPGFEVRRG